jgi:hypothetical protein
MIDLDYKEYETFKTPDKEEWLIKPLLTEDMKMVLKFTDLNDQQVKLKEQGKNKELTELIYIDLVKIANELIDKSVVNKKTGEVLSIEWRTPYINLIKLASLVIQTTVGNTDNIKEDGEIPLELPQKSSEASGGTSTPSKKKGGRKKS